jgi:glucose dehydrogenase
MLPHLTRAQTTELLKQWRKKRVRETEKDNDTGTGSEAAASEVARKKASRKDEEDDGQRSMFRIALCTPRCIRCNQEPAANASCKRKARRWPRSAI